MKLASVIAIALTIASMGYKSVSRINPASHTLVTSDLSRENCVEEEFNFTSAKECHCYLFQSNGKSYGSFKSPSFPRYYPINIGCILYIFVAAIDELVELTLYEFDLRPRAKDGKCHDYFRLFLNLDRPELNEKDRWDFDNCDEMATLSQSVFYSRHRVIIAEFHTSGEVSYNYKYRGFKGNFKFLKRGQFKMDGERLDDHPCRFRFDARSFTSGRIFSPNYPQNYPNNTNCVYEFIAKESQRIIVDFAHVTLHPSKGRCDPVSAGDRLVVYDGLSKSDRVLARYCGMVKVRQVVSHGSQLSVRLSADSDGVQAQGFAGQYQFVNRHTVQPTRLLDDTMRGDGQVSPGSACAHQFHSTEERKSGLFELPETPYQPNFSCLFTFRGRPGERVVIEFRSVQLDDANQQWCRSHGGDRIEIYDGMSDAQKWLEVICGKVEHKRVTSTGPSLTVKFKADETTSSVERGFEAKYSFIDEEELRKEMSTPAKEGNVATGPSTAAVEGTCRYQVFSQVEEKSGIMQSPGYPNGYKKDFICYWLFYGNSNERIRIKILDFSLNKKQDSSINVEFASKDSCGTRDRIEIYTFYYQEAIGQVKRNEAPLEFCGDADPTFVMSGKRARLDLFFRSLHGSHGSARGVRFRYMFVTDFGVRAVGAVQKPKECWFDFSGLHTSNGSFTSPNYPGNYPEDLDCDFVFKGRAQQRISISFADFDLASTDTSPGCTSSPGDYVEVLGCYISGYSIVRPEYSGPKKFCRRPQKGTFYRIDWPSSCLHLRFHSNSEYTKRGFFAYYSFYYDSDYVGGSRSNCSNNKLLSNFLAIFTTLMLLCYPLWICHPQR